MDNLDEMVKNELLFCQEIDCEKNDHGVFIYKSVNEVHSMNLPFVLFEYKQWLIEKGIVKE